MITQDDPKRNTCQRAAVRELFRINGCEAHRICVAMDACHCRGIGQRPIPKRGHGEHSEKDYAMFRDECGEHGMEKLRED